MDDPAPEPNTIIIKVIVLIFLILVNALLNLGEIAIITINDSKVRKRAEDGDKKSKKLLKLLDNPSKFLSAVQTGTTLAGYLASAMTGICFAPMLSDALCSWMKITDGVAKSAVFALSVVVITVFVVFLSLVLGELFPKRIGRQHPERFAASTANFLLFTGYFLFPLIKALTASANALTRLFGFDPDANEENVTEENILMMVDVGEEKGVIEESQKEMINNIFEFDDRIAGDVMTHRTDIEAIDISDNIYDVIRKAIDEGLSRIPVFEEELDNIKGIVYVKDLLKYVGEDLPKNLKISDVMREATFVPESKKCVELYREMTGHHNHMVIVSDEYGGVAGLVTIEDLLESIVGNIQDEFDNEDEDFTKVNDTTFNIEGISDIEEVEDLLDIKFPDGEYETVAGYIMSVLGKIPDPNEKPSVEYAGYKFTVIGMDERRIDRILAEKLPSKSQNNPISDN